MAYSRQPQITGGIQVTDQTSETLAQLSIRLGLEDQDVNVIADPNIETDLE